MAQKKYGKKLLELHKLILPAFSEEMLSNIPEEEANDFRRFKLIPQELLTNAPWNYKEDDDRIQEDLTENIKNQGQTENINVRLLETGYFQVGNGNHRNTSFKKMGRTYVLCCDHGDISEGEFKRRCIEQNETRFPTNQLKLSNLMKELVDSIGMEDLEITMPFTGEDIQDMMKLTDFDWNQYNTGEGDQDPPGGEGGEKTVNLSILCDHETYAAWLELKAKVEADHQFHDDAGVFRFLMKKFKYPAKRSRSKPS